MKLPTAAAFVALHVPGRVWALVQLIDPGARQSVPG
jgi:hypothetical protein